MSGGLLLGSMGGGSGFAFAGGSVIADIIFIVQLRYRVTNQSNFLSLTLKTFCINVAHVQKFLAVLFLDRNH